MNLNDFIAKVIICSVMRIDRADDRNSEMVYFGIQQTCRANERRAKVFFGNNMTETLW